MVTSKPSFSISRARRRAWTSWIGAAGEVVDPELGVGLVLGEDVPGDHEHGVGDGEDRLGLASAAEAAPEALVLRAQVGAAGACRGPGGLHHRGAQCGVALAGAPR